MSKYFQRVVSCIALLCATMGQVNGEFVVADSINGGATPSVPLGFPQTWNVGEVGWFYTPTFSYDLTGIATKFGSANAQIVTAEIYSAHPSIGTLLRSADFSPIANAFAGGQFAALRLVANETYFFGFRNVRSLGVNVTNDIGATNLPGRIWFDLSRNGRYSSSGPAEGSFLNQPIVQFQTQTVGAVVPEPSSFVLFAIGACCVGVGATRRRRRIYFA